MNNIRTIREQTLGITQAELAQKLGVKQATVSRWETGDLKFDDRTLLAVEALAARVKRKRSKAPSVAAA